ncbi:hypothetical protein C882_2129 [Caenispirillum salinarum AK4]|uniref:Uncharacterized protein n=1 Tax=Caenispirillum salinarum AK4 TaxID=1238182 RepID=K9GLL8_9PROT|nr:hypothetical protein C882_2129 [Caenispirillum salinarum AK4]
MLRTGGHHRHKCQDGERWQKTKALTMIRAGHGQPPPVTARLGPSLAAH